MSANGINPASFERLFLTGFMGAGKTTVGRLLARALGRGFRDLDEEIVKEAGRDVPGIFSEGGEAAFREIETRVLGKLTEEKGVVVALGGGSLIREKNRERVLRSGLLVYLEASRQSLADRVCSGVEDRPLLSGDWPRDCPSEWNELFEIRRPGYESATIRINTDHKPPERVSAEIVSTLGNRRASGAATERAVP